MERKKAGDVKKEGEMELGANRRSETSAFSCSSKTGSLVELLMRWELVGEKLRETALTRDSDVRLPTAD